MSDSNEYPDADVLYGNKTALPPAPDEYPDASALYGTATSRPTVAPTPPLYHPILEELGHKMAGEPGAVAGKYAANFIDTISGGQQSPSTGVLGAVGSALQAQPSMMADAMTNPITQAHALPYVAGAVGSVIGGKFGGTIGNVGGNLLEDAALSSYGRSDQIPSASGQVAQGVGAGVAEGIGSFLEVPASLKSAGVTPATIEHMAPGGQTPAGYVKAVESQLQENGVLGKTANETWNLMNTEKEKVGQTIGGILDQIKQASPDALMVDAKTALKPVLDEAQKRAVGLYTQSQNTAKPFLQAFNGLMDIADQQGGKLTLENIDSALQETGQMMSESTQDAQPVFSKIYGKLANVRDGIVQTIANQSGNPNLASNLLKSNADYSTYMRLLPSVEKSAYKEAIKEGVSAYQKYGGPLVARMATAGGIYAGARKAIDTVMGQ